VLFVPGFFVIYIQQARGMIYGCFMLVKMCIVAVSVILSKLRWKSRPPASGQLLISLNFERQQLENFEVIVSWFRNIEVVI
jgi:hypothetical protein